MLKKNMRKTKCIFIIFILTVLLIYISNISNIPNSLVLLEGEKINLNTLFGIKTVCVSNDIAETQNNKMNIGKMLLIQTPSQTI